MSAVAAIGAVLLAGAGAEVSLAWEAPNECPVRRVVEDEVEHLVGRTVEFGEPAAITARAIVRVGWVAEVEVTSAQGAHRRELSAKTCGELARALALILSLAIDDRASAGDDARSGDARAGDAALVPERADVRSAGRRRVVTSVIPGVEERELPDAGGAFALVAGAFVDVGSLPSPALGLSAGVSWWPIEQLSFGTGGSILLAQRALVRASPEAGGAMTSYAVRVRACFHAPRFDLLPLELAGCAGAELALVSARGFGVTTTRRETARWLAPFAGLTATYPFADRVAITAHLEAQTPSLRPIFVLDGLAEIHRTPAILTRAGFAAEVHFP